MRQDTQGGNVMSGWKRGGWALAGLLSFGAASSQEMIVQTVTYRNGDLELRGFLYRPQGNGPFPAIVYNHGSEKTLAYVDNLARPFVRQGYVFFAPNRRGQGRSPGPYIGDQLAGLSGAEYGRALVRLHEEQLSDQLAGLAFLKAQPFIRPDRVGVFGWSFGGIQTLLAVEQDAYRAAVNCAGAAQTWNQSPELRERLLAAVRAARSPIFFLQAKNDYSLSALEALSAEMARLGKPHQVRVYPDFGSSAQQGHEFCALGAEEWGPEVFAFFASHLR